MPNMTLALPEELHRSLRRYPAIRWAEVARRAFRRELRRIESREIRLSASKLSEADAIEIGRDIRRRKAPRPVPGRS